jgi:hypothetical protein
LGIVTTSSETVFTQSAGAIYDFVTNPENWAKAYPGNPRISNVGSLPLEVGDTWDESHPEHDRTFTWRLAVAMRPRLWVFNSVGRLGHDSDGNGGMEGRMTIEAYKDSPMPDGFFRIVNPVHIDEYHVAIAQHLQELDLQ